jgi:hypothetical protein
MSKKQKIIVALVAALIAFAVVYSFAQRNSLRKKRASQVMTENHQNQGVSESNVLNNDNVSPITGLPCDNWNRRPIAVMQPSDVAARPASGFSEADMVIEMPVITATITRLMGVYICNNPESVGSMRSARHDFVSLAKGMDAIFVHWGRSHMDWFIEKLDNGIIDNINCNDDAGKSAGRYCFRHPDLVGMHSGYMKFDKILEAANDFGYRLETDFEGYFSKMTPDGIFMGTDATEYWTVTEFKVWAKPYFDNGKAWSFTAHNRHIYFSDDGKTAWFDEELKTPNLGPSRGSGVLSYSESEESWKIAHYNLAIPVPNEIVDSVVTQIEEFHSNQD